MGPAFGLAVSKMGLQATGQTVLEETISVPRAPQANCRRIKGTDMHGGDIPGGSSPDRGFNDCVARCLARPDCHHFTIVYGQLQPFWGGGVLSHGSQLSMTPPSHAVQHALLYFVPVLAGC